MIRNSYKTLMALLAAAAVTFAISASAQAAVRSVKPAASGFCWILVDKGDGLEASISSSGVLDFIAASQQNGFCFNSIANTNFDVIYTPNSSDCLAWSNSAQDVYQHNPTGCGSNTNYLEWAFDAVGSSSSGEYYLFQNQYSGMCFYSYGGSGAKYGPCNTGSQADEFYLETPPA